MKNVALSFVCLFFTLSHLSSLSAQEKEPFRIGVQLNQLQGDFGIGLDLGIPLPGRLPSLRLSGTNQWVEIPDENTSTWAAFQIVRLGVSGTGWTISDNIRVYGEGGSMVLFPDNDLSAETAAIGGYGILGFEFQSDQTPGMSYFLETGGTTAGARIERRSGIPTFGAGFMIAAGIRFAH